MRTIAAPRRLSRLETKRELKSRKKESLGASFQYMRPTMTVNTQNTT